ncbi:PhzF family phenazine biosynthesis protein [Streptomyces sp. LBL]|uniref:PhzF family phenazine biosynthesis protein n=1 Tax=Streptomyces sp. LBL TaxID=2940562 RepID=UPI002473B2B9|nr:PhzF family phenazine biosynthesis isomerase [Streptomyces sp. LBL]MDH6624251.1 PhzF family phenazine biosynthesis protein [Streptomyces sp. LBL]
MDVLRYVAFTTDPAGGNPAGVVLDATGIDDATMLKTAAEVGYSETAFVVPCDDGSLDIRYFSPLAEVTFCGHATIATAVAHAQRHGVGPLRLRTRAGEVTVSTAQADDGSMTASLVSVPPRSLPLAEADLAELLAALRWTPDDLDPALPPRVAYAGAWHPVIAATSRGRLADLAYDMTALSALMTREDWTTVDLVWREAPTVFHARNPFPPGGVVEDPATGASAAAFGGYLRELELVPLPATVTIHQGADMGRPSTITVTVPREAGSGIEVSGAAVQI